MSDALKFRNRLGYTSTSQPWATAIYGLVHHYMAEPVVGQSPAVTKHVLGSRGIGSHTANHIGCNAMCGACA